MSALPKAASGVAGLDNITSGGFARGRVYLLEGDPGTGKTTLGLQFLLAGAAIGEKGLYITLSETDPELRETMRSHGWNHPPELNIFELVPPENLLDDEQQQSLLYSSDLELGETTRRIFEIFEKTRPARVVLDSLSEIRLLAQSSLRYRRQILALKHYFARSGATVLLLDDLTSEAADRSVHSVAHGVIRLTETSPEYGSERRRLRIIKYRGQHFRGGHHDFVIDTGGLRVFPRLISAEHRSDHPRRTISTDNGPLDALLGGGFDSGTSTLVLGPAGTGKSLFAMTFIKSAIARGERASMFIFDEEIGLLISRALGVGVDLQAMIDAGDLTIQQVDAAEMSPGQFSELVRMSVEMDGAKTVLIDSLNGFQAAMPGENALILHMHELLQYLNRKGASTFLTVAQHGLVGDMKTPVDLTYLADTVVLLRYFESLGEVRRAISVVKKRAGAHETTIREYRIDRDGISLGAPLTQFQGILRGVPTIVYAPGSTETMSQ